MDEMMLEVRLISSTCITLGYVAGLWFKSMYIDSVSNTSKIGMLKRAVMGHSKHKNECMYIKR